MDPLDESNNKAEPKEHVIISFDKICTIFPNVKEPHFLNSYEFNTATIKKFKKFIEHCKENKQDDKNIKLEKIKFIHYDDPTQEDNIDKNKQLINDIERLCWKIAKPKYVTNLELR